MQLAAVESNVTKFTITVVLQKCKTNKITRITFYNTLIVIYKNRNRNSAKKKQNKNRLIIF